MAHRIKIRDRELPIYSKGEEIFNMVTHIVGGAWGLATLVISVILAAINYNALYVVCMVIFGVSMTTLYTMSSIYHGLKVGTAKKVFQVIDHCTIYLLIAGTYTPIVMCSLIKVSKVAAYITLFVVWLLAIIAITLTAVDIKKYKLFSMICYVGMGWAIIFSISKMYEALGSAGFWLLLSGGIAYTIGVIFYNLGKKIKYMHGIFHLFVLIGSILHSLCVIFYVL